MQVLLIAVLIIGMNIYLFFLINLSLIWTYCSEKCQHQ